MLFACSAGKNGARCRDSVELFEVVSFTRCRSQYVLIALTSSREYDRFSRSFLPSLLLRCEPSFCADEASNAQVLNVIPVWASRSVVWTEIAQFFAWEFGAESAMFDSPVRTAFDKVAVHVV
jgi:hypothetical protein